MEPGVPVVMVTLDPAIKFPTVQLLPLPISSCPLVVGAEEIPVPPDVTPKTWPKVKLLIVVVAKVLVALTVNPPVEVKVNRDEVATGLVPLPNRISDEVKLAAPVPPLATDRVPET